MRFALAALAGIMAFAAPHYVQAAPIRILIAAGSSEGYSGEKALKFTGDDVARVRNVLVARGGVGSDTAIALTNPTAAELWSAMNRAEAIARAHRPDEVSLFFYFSGHGDARGLHLGRESISSSDLAARLGKIPARLRIVITDACRSSDALREKGASIEPAFAVDVDEMKTWGAVWLHASSDGESAQESDELGGSVFTHYWVTGLNGAADANGDGRVTLSESFAYAYDQTIFRTARTSRIMQRPSLSLELRESGPLVLTQTSAASARLVLPRGSNVSYVVYATGSHAVISEAWGQDERAIALGLPAGRYVVQRRGPGRYGAAEIVLSAGEGRQLGDSDFRNYPEDSLVAKGGTLQFHPHEIGAGYAFATGRLTPFGHGPMLLYAYRMSDWALGAHAAVTFSSRDAEYATETSQRWEAGLSLDRAWGEWLRIGLGPIISFYNRRFQRTNADLLRAGGYSPTETQRTVTGGVELHAIARVSLGPRFWCGLRLDATANIAKLDGTTQLLVLGTAGPMLGGDF